ncbi:GNAT family N-acetyltransferase [Streptomyces sp. SP18CS02]|uniref:GNAT family N-acetyltransferase n=1 Tax=Streptomyces sp. SP18CS02 TaxID=3002531 RepID=UPI002E79A13E|nr:GNAT family protein [Streptomyces sp. SP18CS02]MEE1753705.1 GNAT family protein [Streptomyces sp. SP18CS02]
MSEDTTGAFSVKPTLTGDRVVLRPFTEADTAVMAEILRDPEVRRFTGSADDEPPLPEERLRSWYGSRGAQSDRLDLALVDRASGEVVGELVFNEWDEANRSCNFRVLVGPRGRDRGLGTEAIRLFLAHGFGHLGLNRVSLGVFAFNPRAVRTYEKVGFVLEGVEREVLLHRGEWIDSFSMAVLAREWAVHRGHPATTGTATTPAVGRDAGDGASPGTGTRTGTAPGVTSATAG